MVKLHTPEGEVHLKRTRSARRMSLRISSLDRRITLSVPAHVSDRDAFRFLEDKQDWVRDQLNALPERLPASKLAEIEIEGRSFRLVGSTSTVATPSDDPTTILVPAAATKSGPALAAFLMGTVRGKGVIDFMDGCQLQKL